MHSDGLFLTKKPTNNWNGFHLILPSVSISNVGQLAVDMLLHNLKDKVKKVSGIYDEALLPVAGNDHNGEIFESMEVFEAESLQLVIIQQRAPFVKGRIPSFRQRLLAWIERCQFKKVTILSSVSSHVKTDADLNESSPFRFLCNKDTIRKELVSKHQWIEYSVKKLLEHKESLELPGSGIAKSLYEDSESLNIPFLVCLVFCNHGDSRKELHVAMQHLQQYLNLEWTQGELLEPSHWKIQSTYDNELMIF